MTVERSRRVTRRRLLQSLAAGASALGLAPLLAACGQGAPAADGDPPTAALPEAPAATVSTQNTITVWYYDGSLGKTIEAFKRAHPTIGVDLKQFGDADQGLIRALQSGAGLPDVSIFFSGSAGMIAQRGGLHDLSAAPLTPPQSRAIL
jgi:ABC-type glycerol-3-phosphate transport system substrate-binding protein